MQQAVKGGMAEQHSTRPDKKRLVLPGAAHAGEFELQLCHEASSICRVIAPRDHCAERCMNLTESIGLGASGS